MKAALTQQNAVRFNSRFRWGGAVVPGQNPEEQKEYILKQVLANWQAGKGIQEIATIAAKSRFQIRNYMLELEKRGQLTRSEGGHVIKSPQVKEARDIEKLSVDEFCNSYESVGAFAKHLRESKKNKKWSNTISALRKVCSLLHIRPDYLIERGRFALVGPNSLDELMGQFGEEINKGKKRPLVSLRNYAGPVCNYIEFHGVAVPEGLGGNLTREKTNYKKYNNIELSDPAIDKAVEYLAREVGETEALFFALGVEGMYRFSAGIDLKASDIHTMRLGDYEYLTFQVFESKTEAIYTKYVINPKVIRLFKHCAERASKNGIGQDYLFHVEGVSPSRRLAHFCETNRKAFASIGIDTVSDGKGKLINYWRDKSEHALRHIGIALWLRRLGFNASMVASMVHETIEMTSSVYSNTAGDKLFHQGECYRHNPPELKGDSDIFCSITCAIKYLNQSDDRSDYFARVKEEAPITA